MTLQRLVAAILAGAVLTAVPACGNSREQLEAAPSAAPDEHGHEHEHDEPVGEPTAPTAPPASVPPGSSPAVTGTFGRQAAVTIPDGQPPASLSRRIISAGDGRAVAPGDVIMAHHLGATWSGKRVFENSFTAGRPVGFSIGLGNVIAGWDEGLIGVPSGSRVLLIVPPEKGYGADGHPDAEVSPDETLVYVIDVLGTHPPGEAAEGVPAPLPAGMPSVTLSADGHPEVKAPPSPPPADLRKAILRRGDGEAVRPGSLLVVQYTGTVWRDSNTFTSTWDRGSPVPVVVGEDPFRGAVGNALVGVPVGSRVLLTVPPADGYGEEGLPEAGVNPDDTIVYVIDVLGEYGTFTPETAPPVDDHDHGAEGEGAH